MLKALKALKALQPMGRAPTRLAAPLLLLAGIELLGCTSLADARAGAGVTAPQQVPQQIIVLDRNLKALATPLPALVDRSVGIELRSCADLLEALRNSKDLGEVTEFPQFNAYVDCLAVALVGEGRAARASTFDLQHAGERIYRDLDLAQVRSSLAPRRPSEHFRLSDFKPAALEIKPLSVSLRVEGFSYEFRVLALGDFRHLDRSELLVRFIDRADVGIYHHSSLLVLDVSTQSSITATDALDVLRGRPAALTPVR